MSSPCLQLPDEAIRVPGSDPEEFLLGALRIEVRRHDHTLDVVLHNTGEQELAGPGLLLRWEPRCPVAWLSGGTGIVVEPDGGSVWRMVSGCCGDTGGRSGGPVAEFFGRTLRLAPGKRAWTRWRREEVAVAAALPEWVPRRRHLPLGEVLEFTDPDLALSGEGLLLETTGETTLVRGGGGLHLLGVHGPAGVTELEIGWFPEMADLVAAALANGPTAEIRAWLLSWAVTGAAEGEGERMLDELDLALAALGEQPGLFGVLALLRAAATTQLPLQDEASRSARDFLTSRPGDAEFVAVAAVLSGQPWLVLDGPSSWSAASSDELLWTLEHAMPSSVTPGYTARDLARARLWLASNPDSARHLGLAEACVAARARLMCIAAQGADPTDVAWLLLGEVLT